MTATTDIPAAPWKSLFVEHISKLDDPFMSVSTVGYDSQSESPVPRVRTCGFRGFFGELRLHPSAEKQLRDEKELNPSLYESDMLTFTTDVRMGKVEELQQFQTVEVLFWVKDIMAQWRLRGKAFVIGDEESKVGETKARAEISRGLRVKSNDVAESQKWDWNNEVTAYFANHSPLMRGSFKGPTPGRPLSEKPEDPNLRLGQRVEDLHDATARKHFRVVVIRVEEVDRLNLTNPERGLRWRTTLHDRHWEEVELWP